MKYYEAEEEVEFSLPHNSSFFSLHCSAYGKAVVSQMVALAMMEI